MSEKILVPELGESITEATLAKWLKNKGDSINADEPIVELETDKVNLEVPSPITGVVSEINFKNGDTVEVGSVLGIVSEEQNKKIEKLKTNEKLKENNTEKVIRLEENNKNEKKMFEQKKDKEEPLVLTEEI